MNVAKLEIHDRELRKQLGRLDKASRNVQEPFRLFAQYMRVQTDEMFERNRSGGTHRGVTWAGPAPQYVRSDGTVVPAWGGIPYARGEGTVKPRTRPSGQPFLEGDALMQDTNTMRARAALAFFLGKRQLKMGPQGVNYAAYQNAMRPFLFFNVPDDSNTAVSMLQSYLRRKVRG